MRQEPRWTFTYHTYHLIHYKEIYNCTLLIHRQTQAHEKVVECQLYTIFFDAWSNFFFFFHTFITYMYLLNQYKQTMKINHFFTFLRMPHVYFMLHLCYGLDIWSWCFIIRLPPIPDITWHAWDSIPLDLTNLPRLGTLTHSTTVKMHSTLAITSENTLEAATAASSWRGILVMHTLGHIICQWWNTNVICTAFILHIVKAH